MSMPTDHFVFESEEEKVLFACKLEIEESWMRGEGAAAVHRLARAHPAFSKELYLFFAFMLEVHGVMERAAPARRREAQQPRPFLALLRDVEDESVQTLAASMDITPDFLVAVSDHGGLVPLAVRRELVRRARNGRAIDESEAIASFDVASLQRAASRDTPYAESTLTFADVVKRSRLDAGQQRFWSSLA